jgi:acyl dehydratase
MLLIVDVKDLPSHVGATLGPSPSVTVDQAMIDKFADATGDHQWIHVDPERAKRELPWGTTIAHGYLTLALIPRLMRILIDVRCRHALNYGSNRVRFVGVVPVDSRVCMYQTIKGAEAEKDDGCRLASECRMMVEGRDRPALVCEVMSIFYA